MLPVQKATLTRFIRYITDKNRSTATKDRYTYWLTKLADHIPKPFEEMVAADLAKYLRSLDDLKPASRNTARDTFHHFFVKYIKKPEAMEHPKLEKEPIPIESPEILSDDELRQLIGAAKTPRDKAILTVLIEGGMRVGSLAEFPEGSPALQTGPGYMAFGDVEKVPHGYKIHLRHTKDREELWAPIYYYAADLKQWLTLHPTQQDEDPLWCYQKSGELYPLGYGALKMIVQQAAKRAGIKKKVHPHLLRKQWASMMKEKRNLDSWDIAQMGGWVPGSRQMRRYIRQNPNAVHDRYAKSLGIEEQTEEPLGPAVRKECLNCGEVLSPTSIYCPHCGQIQDKETVELHREAIKEDRKAAAQYQERFERQDEKMEIMKQQLAEQQKQIEELQSVKCPECGAGNPAQATTCAHCGASIDIHMRIFDEFMLMFLSYAQDEHPDLYKKIFGSLFEDEEWMKVWDKFLDRVAKERGLKWEKKKS